MLSLAFAGCRRTKLAQLDGVRDAASEGAEGAAPAAKLVPAVIGIGKLSGEIAITSGLDAGRFSCSGLVSNGGLRKTSTQCGESGALVPTRATRTTVRPVTVATETVVGSFRCAQKSLEPSQILKQEKPFFPSRPRHPEDGRNRA